MMTGYVSTQARSAESGVRSSPFIVGIGGSNRLHSVTDRLLEHALAHVAQSGGRTQMFSGAQLSALPIYGTDDAPAGEHFADVVSSANGVIIATPGYHGGMSGLLKNALDHLEALRDGPNPYLDGKAVGLIVSASGWQACGTSVVSLRSTVHALRGWPTPYAATLNSAEELFGDDDALLPGVAGSVELVARQVMDFARWRAAAE